jgi:hypothetical protein
MPCPVINDICTKKYEFGPFWGQSKLRKEARDELCAICNSFHLFDPDLDYDKFEKMFRQKFGRFTRYISIGDLARTRFDEYNVLANVIVVEQEKMRDSFLLRVKMYIENSKGSNPPSIQLIRQWYDRTYLDIQGVIGNAIKFYSPPPILPGDEQYEAHQFVD